MKNRRKINIILKLWNWISLGINVAISLLSLFIKHEELYLLLLSIIAPIFIIVYGILDTSLAINKDNLLKSSINELSKSSVYIQYIGIVILSIIIAYVTYKMASIVSAIIILLALVIEFSVTIVLNYWNGISNYFYRRKNKNNKN